MIRTPSIATRLNTPNNSASASAEPKSQPDVPLKASHKEAWTSEKSRDVDPIKEAIMTRTLVGDAALALLNYQLNEVTCGQLTPALNVRAKDGEIPRYYRLETQSVYQLVVPTRLEASKYNYTKQNPGHSAISEPESEKKTIVLYKGHQPTGNKMTASDFIARYEPEVDTIREIVAKKLTALFETLNAPDQTPVFQNMTVS